MDDRAKVHVIDGTGKPRYNRLLDGGGPILDFEMGWGFLTRELIARLRFSIVPGWLTEEELHGPRPA